MIPPAKASDSEAKPCSYISNGKVFALSHPFRASLKPIKKLNRPLYLIKDRILLAYVVA